MESESHMKIQDVKRRRGYPLKVTLPFLFIFFRNHQSFFFDILLILLYLRLILTEVLIIEIS